VASIAVRWNALLALTRIENCWSLQLLAHCLVWRRCSPIVESHCRGLVVLIFSLLFRFGRILVGFWLLRMDFGICRLILSCILNEVRPMYPAITAAHVLIYDHTLLSGGHMIFVHWEQNFLGCENDSWLGGAVAFFKADLVCFSNFRGTLPIQGRRK